MILHSDADGLALRLTVTYPDIPPVGILQIAHGMVEHRVRYFPFCDAMAQHGYITVVSDHRGHGESVRSPNDLGYFYENGAVNLVEDLHQITKYIRSEHPSLPCFLLGHSMGSLAARVYLKKYDRDLDGVILSGSPSFNPALSAGQSLAKSLARIHGDRFKSEMINQLAFEAFNKEFSDGGSSFNWICSDPAVVDAFEADPLCGFGFTINGYQALLDLMQMAYSEADWALDKPELPIWFIAGELDPCIVNRRKFIEAVGAMQYAGYENVTYRLYPEMRHEILNECEKEKVYSDIINRLERWRRDL